MSKDSEYDYVIVGAGSAGCVLAARLSEDPATRVALVESGPRDRKPEIRIPAAFPKLFKTPYDWNFSTAKQSALDGRELFWPRGHMLGGSSSMNAMMWVRGHRDDYDAWGEAAGPEWSYEEFERYFRRAERWTGPADAGTVYGTEGPLWISPPRALNPTTPAFLDACRAAGLSELTELNGPDNGGFALTPVNQRRGRRWSAADGYLRTARRRRNLHILTDARVRRLEFDGTRVAGVIADGVAGKLIARREVILSAGAIGSPHLLQASGVGDPDELSKAGIETRVAAPDVGRHLQDHLAYSVTMRCPQPVTLTGADSLANVGRFLLGRRGPLTSNVAEAVAFIRTRPELTAPDIELIYAPVPFVDHGLVPPTEHGITIGVVLLQPQSEGRITPTRPGVSAPPRIDPGYLTADADIATLVAGVRRAEELLKGSALAPYASGPLDPYPGTVDDDTLARSIRGFAETLYHPVGTCRMGGDERSVTDPTLRVRGVQALRVVDASVMPRITRGHTHAPTVALAEKAAELIRADAPRR
ncbi:GMC family oxidoreductase N-terminal domain-containing protein [Streptomyces sp. NBC_01381]|uniref:GMC family oxidoreductase n=1 Tax=Streptomyces sp. NBC_01381 TaxID=2903845 RepID=UPI00224DFBBC|nr:GMC family oxidoreductase N-terminal domain-containing protein [Streptomyces sp. NBC_01381]MCX4671596.1 GMC family oxidoreductase N-terminal domain-containing protein [Streptomyces sp. NBC_01381]